MTGFLRWIELDRDCPDAGYPYALPVVTALRAAGRLKLDPAVTFLTGDNGTGKSTLIEAIAVAAGFNAEGGSVNFRFSTKSTESSLGGYMRLVRSPGKPSTGYFLRAESFYNVVSEIDRLAAEPGPSLHARYGGRSLHERSHGESFLDLAMHRFGRDGLYVLDEPEAALSVPGCLALIARIHELVGDGCQFVIATHSPVLLAVPGALILRISDDGAISEVDFDEAEPVALTRSFLADPDRFLRHLL